MTTESTSNAWDETQMRRKYSWKEKFYLDTKPIGSAKTALIPIKMGVSSLVDADDLSFLRQFNWHQDHFGYASTRILFKDGIKRDVRMHVMLFGEMCDHRNRDRLDNRRTNLRPCNRAENSRNSKPRLGRKYKGTERTCMKTIRARIRHNGSIIELGNFRTEIEAAKAYDKKAKELFGEFAYLNFPPVS